MATREGELVVGTKTESAEDLGISVVVHPLVLLSTVDHYNRVAKDTRKRVVGVLLGTRSRGTVDVTNSFAVPFEEDLKNPAIWYLDHNYLETMYRMYKKVNAREQIVGFYSSGPKIKENDIKIDELVRGYCPGIPVFVIIDVRPENEAIPTTAYVSVEEVLNDGEERKEIRRTFKHVSSAIGAYEAEEVGVEHLLRDVNDPTVSTLASQIKHKMSAISTLRDRLAETKAYLEAVLAGKLPVNNHIVYNLQIIFNLIPNLNVDDLVKSMLVKTNDMHLAIYCAALVRCIIALHNLVNNKIANKRSDEATNVATTTTTPKDDKPPAPPPKENEEAVAGNAQPPSNDNDDDKKS
ncbi:hypothetical protein CTAYLR_000503 [Chrysophaeum taylorii]|uniref:MPN domain-containing protein n=1 Tax=Chrysophaeum taylorii TaxID=2483200 RepID=A0AAD7UG51_9STRA|nr:hypothetical protein CTAYLR_000503 [Chrysophaeum taylorii]